MKHSNSARSTESQRLHHLAAEAGINVGDSDADTLVRYLHVVLEINRRINLTRIDNVDSAIRLHVVDSLTGVPELTHAPIGRTLDLGSGGGFPGVPMSVVCRREFVLLDSVAKKMSAVANALEEAGIPRSQVTTHAARAEDLARREPASFAAVVARAVTALPALVELASPLLEQNGLLIAMKGRLESKERVSGAIVAAQVGMREVSARSLILPGGSEERTIVTYIKDGESAVRLPRREGLAQHQPLA